MAKASGGKRKAAPPKKARSPKGKGKKKGPPKDAKTGRFATMAKGPGENPPKNVQRSYGVRHVKS